MHGVSPSVGGDVYSPIVFVDHGGVPDHKSLTSVRVAAHQALRLMRHCLCSCVTWSTCVVWALSTRMSVSTMRRCKWSSPVTRGRVGSVVIESRGVSDRADPLVAVGDGYDLCLDESIGSGAGCAADQGKAGNLFFPLGPTSWRVPYRHQLVNCRKLSYTVSVCGV